MYIYEQLLSTECVLKVKPMHIYIKCNFCALFQKPSIFLMNYKTKINFCKVFKYFQKVSFFCNIIDEHIIIYPSECHIICF